MNQEAGQMDIRKIRYDGTKVQIELRRKNDQDFDDVSFASKDAPRPLFVKQLGELLGDFAYFLELPTELLEKLTVLGVNVGEHGGSKTFRLVGGLKTSAGFVSLNTPTLYEQSEELESGPAVLTKKQRQRIQSVLARAEEYYLGGRNQGDIFAPEAVDGSEATEEAEEEVTV